MLSVTGPAGPLDAGVFAVEGVAVGEASILVGMNVAGDPGCVVAVAAIVVPGAAFCPQPASNAAAMLTQMMLII